MVLSGGQDSTIALFKAAEEFDEIHAIAFDYGQRHKVELVAAQHVSALANVASFEFIDARKILVSASPLLSENNLDQYESHSEMVSEVKDRVERTFVPMRNTFFAIVAANRAISLGCSEIGLGVCENDSANYPDCTNNFILALQQMFLHSLGPEYNLGTFTPLLHTCKKDAIQWAFSKNEKCWEALAYTHTSYNGEYPPLDKNHANILRAKSFEEAGLPDPLILRAVSEGLMSLPKSENYKDFK